MRRTSIFWIILAVGILSFASFLSKLKRPEAPAAPKAKVREEKAIQQGAAKVQKPHKKAPPKPHINYANGTSYLITPNRYAYTVLLDEKQVEATRDGKRVSLKRRTKRRILYRVKRSGLKNCVCQRVKARRFLCAFKNASFKEVTLRLNCELLVVAEKREAFKYPIPLTELPERWKRALANAPEKPEALTKLYRDPGIAQETLKDIRGAKYVDLIISDVAAAKLPESPYFVLFFHEILRTNLNREEGIRGLIVSPELQILAQSKL